MRLHHTLTIETYHEFKIQHSAVNAICLALLHNDYKINNIIAIKNNL